MSSCVLFPEATATPVLSRYPNDRYSEAAPVTKTEIEIKPSLEFQKRHTARIAQEITTSSGILSRIYSNNLGFSVFESPFSKAIGIISEPVNTTWGRKELDSFEDLEESDYHIPPKRRYHGRIHIVARYRAMPKYYPDEWEADE